MQKKEKPNQNKKKKKSCVQTTKHDLKAVLWYKLVLWLKNPIVYFSTSSLIDFLVLLLIYITQKPFGQQFIYEKIQEKKISLIRHQKHKRMLNYTNVIKTEIPSVHLKFQWTTHANNFF